VGGFFIANHNTWSLIQSTNLKISYIQNIFEICKYVLISTQVFKNSLDLAYLEAKASGL
jgi:hypothetical protein